MILTHRVAGNSGALKACLLLEGPSSAAHHFQRPSASNMGFICGLLVAGVVTGHVMPWAYESYTRVTDGWVFYTVGGLFTGSGVVLGNGCTSGHGLSGLSKLSLRSLVATPTFMFSASLTAFIKSSFQVGPIAPMIPTPDFHLTATGISVLILGVLVIPFLVARRRVARIGDASACVPPDTTNVPQTASSHTVAEASPKSALDQAVVYMGAAGLWAGLTFGTGLAVGGMVRPSAVSGALSAARFDFTLWFLFCTALVVTFVLYRIAGSCCGIDKSRVRTQGKIDTKLILGALLFGVGWGMTGVCPGPLVVGLAADVTGGGPNPYTFGPLLNLASVALGMHGGRWMSRWMDQSQCLGGKSRSGDTPELGDHKQVAKG